MLYEEAEKRLKELRTFQKEVGKALEKYPEGKIHILQSKNRVQFYLRMDEKEKTGEYVSKKDKEKIRTYLQKKYFQEVLKQMNKEIAALEKFLKNTSESNLRKSSDIDSDKFSGDFVSGADVMKKIYLKYSEEVREYINPIDISDEEYSKLWQEEPFPKKMIPENVPIYITDNGEHVRSKSELNIANALKKSNIPYKYECPLKLSNGIIVHPDFTVLDVKRRREFYWEHRGMMDDRLYVKSAVEKQKEYLKSGIAIGNGLIITEESSTYPLGTDEIKATIEGILGNQ